MSLNLGDLTFGMEADTAGLQRSLEKLQRFGREVDKVARSQQKGAQTAVAAMARQESAIKSALRQTQNLQGALRKAGAPPQELARTTNAFRKLTNTLTKGKVSVLQFTRAQDAFRASTGKTQRALKGLVNVTNKGKKGTSRFSTVLRDLESSAVLAVGPLSGVGSRIRSIGAIAGRSSLKIVALFAGITALTVGVIKLGSGAVGAARQLQIIDTRLQVATGSTIAARAEFAFITKTVKTLGLDLASTAKQYALFAASTRETNLEGQKTREIFTAVTSTSRALSLSVDDTAGVFKAITQIMSKGTVQAEELRGQMGERIPGAFRLAAKAMGKTTQELNKLLKDGKVLSDDFLPKFAKQLQETFGGAALIAAGKLDASMQRLSTSAFLFSAALDKTTGVSIKFQRVVDSATRSVDFLTRNLDKLPIILGAVAGALLFLTGPAIIAGLISLSLTLGIIALDITALNFALLLSPLGLLAAALTGAGVAFLIFGRDSKTAARETDVFIKQNQKIVDLLGDVDDAVLRSARTLISATGTQIQARRLDLISQEETLRASLKLLAVEQILPGPIGRLFGEGVKLLNKDFLTAAEAVRKTNEQVDTLLKQLDVLKEERERGLELTVPIDPKAKNAILDASKAIGRLRQQIQAMAISSEALKDLDRTFDIADKVDKFEKALKKANVEQEKINAFVREFRELLPTFDTAAKKLKVMEDRLKEVEQIGQKAMKSIEDGILNVIDGTKTLGEAFSSMIDTMLRDLTRFFLQSALKTPAGGNLVVDLVGAALGGLVGGGTTVPIPGRKPPVPRVHGGPASPGRSFIVGERRPEIFSPTSAGRIIPNGGMGGPTEVNITIINNATGTEATIKESAVGNTRNIEIMIDDLVASKINNPSSRTSKALRGALSQGVIRR